MKYGSNRLSDIKKKLISELSEIYDRSEAVSLLDVLIEHLFGLSRVDQTLQPEYRLSESELLRLHFAAKELLQHKPVQYITGNAVFMGMRVTVNQSVLIPRPETEELVAKIISNEEKSPPQTILDVGTGSGCIVLSLKRAFQKATITAIDVSKDALAVAKTNAKTHNLPITFLQVDILKGNKIKKLPFFDLIVSNPPYVTKAEQALMRNNVLDYEPAIALFVENDVPLLFYDAIASFSKTHLNQDGKLYFETNEQYAGEIAKMLSNSGFSAIQIEKDIHGKERFVKASI